MIQAAHFHNNPPTTFPMYRETAYRPALTEAMCFICGDTSDRRRVPQVAIHQAYAQLSVIIVVGTRCCGSHLRPDGTFTSAALRQAATVARTPAEAALCEEFDSITISEPARSALNFFDGLREHDYFVYFGLDTEQFATVFQEFSPRQSIHSRLKLAALLCYMRRGITEQMLASLFHLTQPRISQAIRQARTEMVTSFVPKYLGYKHISREQYIAQHRTTFAYKLTTTPPESAICILDGTYIYCQRSKNLLTQKKTYSMHKKRNLVKPMVVSAPDGYFLDVEGTYQATDNDASILLHMLQRPGGFASFFQPEDVMIVDRGFRDAGVASQEAGYRVVSPTFLHGESQFSTLDANSARLVTKNRFSVEADNAKLKRFKLLNNTISNHHLIGDRITDFIRIAASLLNRFHVPVRRDSPEDELTANRMLEKSTMENEMRERMEREGTRLWESRRATDWIAYEAGMFSEFPQLTEEDIQQLTMGVFQLKMAPRYAAFHLEHKDDNFKIWIMQQDDNVLRVRLGSRHKSNVSYYIWISFVPGAHSAILIRVNAVGIL
jgi:hypothetical protein